MQMWSVRGCSQDSFRFCLLGEGLVLKQRDKAGSMG